ncbi:folylpolyglutamate synthase/dihydrofolate synthase family protein [Spirosoma luteolum]
MQYSEAIDYLYSRLPVFHRIGAKALKPGLGNTERLCAALGNPERQFRSIHVGGTNGKGSSSHMLAAIYQQAGYRVGLYTSPHLQSFTERIRINGVPIAETAVAEFVTQQQALIESIEPSFFELTVAMAFDYFARSSVDLAIIEVGLGGRLDSTNVIQPELALITNIGLDHTDILGDTLPLIAAEKAGIIKAGRPVVIGETHPETEPVFRAKAGAAGAPLVVADQAYTVQDGGLLNGQRQVSVSKAGAAAMNLTLDLLGGYQLRNLPGVLAAVELLQPTWPVPPAAIVSGLGQVARLTGLRGRFQTLQTSPRVIADTAHNLPGLRALAETLDSLTYAQLHLVLGMVADKERQAVLAILPVSARYYFCQAQTPRSLPAGQLALEAARFGLLGEGFSDVNQALAAARQAAAPDDLIVVTGSNYTIAELTDL